MNDGGKDRKGWKKRVRPPRGGRPLAAALLGNLGEGRACPQRIVATRPLYRLQDPFARLSRLQRISPPPVLLVAIRGGAPGRSFGGPGPRPPGGVLGRLRGLGAPAWGTRGDAPPLSGTGSGLEAFSRYPAGAASRHRPVGRPREPAARAGGSSRTRPACRGGGPLS